MVIDLTKLQMALIIGLIEAALPNMDAKRPMNTGAIKADENTKRNRRPLRIRGVAIDASLDENYHNAK